LPTTKHSVLVEIFEPGPTRACDGSRRSTNGTRLSQRLKVYAPLARHFGLGLRVVIADDGPRLDYQAGSNSEPGQPSPPSPPRSGRLDGAVGIGGTLTVGINGRP
jgi:hypothetical protein